MKTKYSPGPWAADRNHFEKEPKGFQIFSQDGDPLAELIEDDNTSLEQALANSDLMAAAPQLLKALQKCCGLIRSYGLHSDSDKMIYANAIAAIDKATK